VNQLHALFGDNLRNEDGDGELSFAAYVAATENNRKTLAFAQLDDKKGKNIGKKKRRK
jgi:hypothetical protein